MDVVRSLNLNLLAGKSRWQIKGVILIRKIKLTKVSIFMRSKNDFEIRFNASVSLYIINVNSLFIKRVIHLSEVHDFIAPLRSLYHNLTNPASIFSLQKCIVIFYIHSKVS